MRKDFLKKASQNLMGNSLNHILHHRPNYFCVLQKFLHGNMTPCKKTDQKNSKKDQELIHTLMGNAVTLRKDFIISNAINVQNLDI